MKVFSFRNIRVFILLLILAGVAIYTKSQRLDTTSWDETIDVLVIPVNGDKTAKTEQYIRHMTKSNFIGIEQFFTQQAKKYPVFLEQPFRISIGHPIDELPPPPPKSGGFSALLWSLHLRWWVSQHTPDEQSNYRRIRLYALYYQGEDEQPLRHSLGMQKGLIGVCHLYAIESQNKQNNIVLSHELLHTVGALDKYSAAGAPIYPQGYANPAKKPLYPQYRTEIMAGSRALSKIEHKMGDSLRSTVVGTATASEIGWSSAE